MFEILEKARRVDAAGANLDLQGLKESKNKKTRKPGSRNPGTDRRSRSRKADAEAHERARRTGRLDHAADAISGILAAEEEGR